MDGEFRRLLTWLHTHSGELREYFVHGESGAEGDAQWHPSELQHALAELGFAATWQCVIRLFDELDADANYSVTFNGVCVPSRH